MADTELTQKERDAVAIGEYKYGFHDDVTQPFFKSRRGLDEQIVREISAHKSEPEWMTDFRVKSLQALRRAAAAHLGRRRRHGSTSTNIYYYLKPVEEQAKSWDDLPAGMRETWDKLGIPEAEKKYLAGVGAQYESEVVYHNLQEELEKQGVHLPRHGLRPCASRRSWCAATSARSSPTTTTSSPRSTRPSGRAARSSTCPKGVKVELPLQAYFRINAENMGQFERTLIIVDEDAYVHYVEGCTAPIYSTDSLHSAVVEIHVARGGRCRYTTIQNWSTNVYNLVTKRAVAEADATMEWVDGNLGSQLTMKYPAVILNGERRARRGAVDRVRRQGPAPGRRRQDHPRRAATPPR